MALTIQEYRIYILAAVAVILLAAVSWYGWRRMQKGRHQRHVESVVRSLGLPTIRDAVFPDGLDGLAFIDYLLLVPGGVIVLDVENSEGHLFGGESVDQWSQVINNRTYKFHNPLYANQTKCQAVKWNVENMAQQEQDVHWQTYGWVVFSNAGNFPKGIPGHVSMVDDLADKLAPLINGSETLKPGTRRIWDALHNLSVNTRVELGS